MAEEDDLRTKISGLMPEMSDELRAMIGIPSVAFPGFPAAPVLAMADRAVAAFRRHGVAARLQEVPGGYPAVWAQIPGPKGSATVLLYGHYDVQPAPESQGWTTEPFEATDLDGRVFGRGAADDKSGIAIHLATLAAFDGRPPVGVTLILEGEEETVSHLGPFVEANPEMFRADVVVVADMGNLVVGEPVLTVGLRGHVKAVVELSTLEAPVHSGLFGGAAPDALMALVKLLALLTDEEGACAVPGVESADWEGATYPEEMLRANAGVLDGVDLVGTGPIASRVWSRPSISVLGIDAPSVEEGGNVLQPRARALVAMRIAPGQDADGAMDALVGFLRDNAPGGAHVEVTPDKKSAGFSQRVDGSAFAAMTEALGTAYRRPVGQVGSGGSIPLLASLRRASPGADFVLIGAEDAERSHIHGPDESVDLGEIEHLALAQALLLRALAR